MLVIWAMRDMMRLDRLLWLWVTTYLFRKSILRSCACLSDNVQKAHRESNDTTWQLSKKEGKTGELE